jgi:hypothetical protein
MAIIVRQGTANNIYPMYADAIQWLTENIELGSDDLDWAYRTSPGDNKAEIAHWYRLRDDYLNSRPAIDSYIPDNCFFAIRRYVAKQWTCRYATTEYISKASGDRGRLAETIITVADEFMAIQLALIL